MKDGKTGYLSDPDDVDSFASKIKALKEKPGLRTEMGEYNKKAVRPFLLDNTKQEVLNLVKETLG